MAGRWTVFAVFAVLGFVGGILANWAYKQLFPILLKMFPDIFTAEWLLSGFGGSILTLLIVIIWASFSPEK
ncbi:hypothetical protein FJY84_07425 [Candidatus Bathyarchaeota archaeon]|jgi:hypothetical protein|nr:hypothetical protein [Candidatus Bathyarchaeota archaeon]